METEKKTDLLLNLLKADSTEYRELSTEDYSIA